MAIYYAITTGGNWSSSGTWNTSSGQSTGGFGPPIAGDTANIDSTLLSGSTVTVDTSGAACAILNCTGCVGTLSCGVVNDVLEITGGVTLPSGGGGAVTGTGKLFCVGNVTLTSNGLTFPGSIEFETSGLNNATVTLVGNWVNTGAANIIANGETLSFSGAYNFTCGALSINQDNGVILVAGQTYTVNGILTAMGNSSQLITLSSSSGGSAAYLNVTTAGGSVSYVTATDINSAGGVTIQNASGTNTRTTNWNLDIFYAVSGGGNWSSSGTWANSTGQSTGGAGVPDSFSVVYIDGTIGSSSIVTIDTSSAITSSLICTGCVGTLNFSAGNKLTVSGFLTSEGGSNGNLVILPSGGGGAVTGTGTLSLGNITLTSSGLTFPGILSLGSGTVTLSGNWINTGVFTPNGSTLNHTTSETITCNGGITTSGTCVGTANILLNGGTWSGNFSIDNNMTIGGNVIISGLVSYGIGTLAYSSGTVTTTGSTISIGGLTTLNTNPIIWNKITFNVSNTITLTSNLIAGGLVSLGSTASINTSNGSQLICQGGLTVSSAGGTGAGTATVVVSGGALLSSANTEPLRNNLIIQPSVSPVTIASGTVFCYGTGTISYTPSTFSAGGSGTLIFYLSCTCSTGAIVWGNITVPDAGVTVTLGSALNCSGQFSLTNSTFIDSGYSVSLGAFLSNNSNTRAVTKTGNWQITGGGDCFDISTTTGMTWSDTAGSITLTDTGVLANTFNGGGLTYNNLIIGGSLGSVVITGANTFNTIAVFWPACQFPATVTFPASTTTTCTHFYATGLGNNIITLNSSNPGTAATISVASGIVACNMLSVKDITVTGGATFYAGSGSTNVSNNTGWNFSSYRSPTPANFE